MSDGDRGPSIEERLARLERLVDELRAAVAGDARAEPRRRTAPDPPDASRSAPGPGGSRTRPATEAATGAGERTWKAAAPASPDLAGTGERWLGRVGIAFVVLAFGFLFKYAFDQGWIGPAMRLTLGMLAGTAMLLVGLRLEGDRERYANYLLGGSVAVFYLVGFAAYQLYELVPFWLAFGFMSAVTVLAFVLSERQRIESLAIVGAAGGLATPFLLYTGSSNVPGLVVYTTLLLAGAGAVQFWRGWRALLLLLGFGGFLVMALATSDSGGAEHWVVLGGIAATWALFGGLPLLRAELRRTDPEGWADPSSGTVFGSVIGGERVPLFLLRVGCVFAALAALLEMAALFDWGRGAGATAFAAGFGVYALLARRFSETSDALNAAAETAAILLVLAVGIATDMEPAALLPLAVVGGLMHLAAGRWSLSGVGKLAHVLFVLGAVVYLVGVLDTYGSRLSGAPFGLVQLSLLGAIAATLATSFVLPVALWKNAYRLGVHIAFMLWLAVQFAPLAQDQALISLSWGVYGVLLLMASFRRRDRGLQLTGLATVGVVAAKLLLVDMARVGAIWRILLFMGFGAAFLGLSYLINQPPEERERA